jgi:hypothetical protein
MGQITYTAMSQTTTKASVAAMSQTTTKAAVSQITTKATSQITVSIAAALLWLFQLVSREGLLSYSGAF